MNWILATPVNFRVMLFASGVSGVYDRQTGETPVAPFLGCLQREDSSVTRITVNGGKGVTRKCDGRHSMGKAQEVQGIPTENVIVLTPENCPVPLQDPISRNLSGGPGIFVGLPKALTVVWAGGTPAAPLKLC